MKKNLRIFAASLTLAMLGLPLTAAAQSGSFPEHPIKIVVGTPAGQSGDAVARLVAQKMSVTLGQNVFIENKPGAGAIIGMKAVKDAKPDGYTLMFASVSALAINPAFMTRLPYDSLKDFTAVGLVNSAPIMLVVRNAVPARNLAEFVAHVKKQKPEVNFGSAGIAFYNHVSMEMLMRRTGMKLNHVPYTGDPAAIVGLLGGDVDAMFLTTTVAIPLIKSDKVRPIAIATRTRSPALPDVPTFIESGIEGYEVDNWGSFVAPAGTPAPVVERLNAALQIALDDPDVKKQLAAMGLRPLKSTVAETTAFIAKEIPMWDKAVKEAGIRQQ